MLAATMWRMRLALLGIAFVSAARTSAQTECGGRLRGPAGVLQTPHFPHAFPVPLRCKWIIEHELANGTISVYFTQQYTTSGLTFTEYDYYDDTYKLGERRAFAVTEENITRVKWLQVQSPILVVELSLNALEGTQLRALGLLNVFGLNVTYAVHAAPPPTAPAQLPPRSCSALECRLLGHCYATHDYQNFYCSCFEGYSGEDCGVGPLCTLSANMCKHGGKCRQMGPAAVTCLCADGYTGDLCESQIAPPECGIEECSEVCIEGVECDCNPRDSDTTSARFETRLQVKEFDQLNTNISEAVINELTTYLNKLNITLDDEVEILNISSPDSAGTRIASVRVWSARRGAGALRAALTDMATKRTDMDKRLGYAKRPSNRVSLLPVTQHFHMQPALSLHAITVNLRTEVWEGSEFTFSCTAYGSPDIVFTWYKDGVKINFNGTTRDIWTSTVVEDALGRRISVLGVSGAKQLDSGRWSCAADDAGRRRCRALWLTVLRPPDIRLLPSTLTVDKGDNVSITCLAGASRVHGALGFSWARERTLLPLVPGREVWEDLFPAGSVLKLYNVQKSSEFRCQVSSVAGTNARGVTLWALGPNDEACEASPSHGVRWPRTAPGAHASAACPPGHSGETTRFCEPKTAQRGVKWRQPDFSGCVADSLRSIYEQFSRISHGYSWMEVSNVAHQYGGVLRSLPVHPGEGTIPLKHAREMLQYLLSHAAKYRDRVQSVENLLKIFDTLLTHPDAFLDEEKTFELQNALVETTGMKDDLNLVFHEFSVMSKPVLEDYAAHFKLNPMTTSGNEEWMITSAGVELLERPGNASIIAVQYNDLASRLPSLRSSVEFKNGREIEYLLASPQIQLWASGSGVDASQPHTVTLLFTHIYNYSAIGSKLACGLRSSSEPRAWTTKVCELRIPEPRHVACRCRGLGTYALFTIARSTLTDAERDLRGVVKITVGVGGALCMIAAALQLLSLVPSRKEKLPVLLKATTAGTHSAALLALLECDTRQMEACGGALGWVCAACWCAGCAALCAQPLLLQTQLATGKHHAPAVSLLAGVCILAWLTARLWGGAPLQLGTSAQIVCAAACLLLVLLCLALAVTAALRLRTITYKVPAERRNYLKNRRKVIRHTLILLVTTTAAQAAAVAYVQPGERRAAHVIVLAVVAIANGVAMVVCYVFRDEQCLRAVRRALALAPPTDWADAQGDTSLSLYIKQGGEVESSGAVGIIEGSPSPLSQMASYWRAPGPESPARMHRRQSAPDSRADIVRCVEYATWGAGVTRAACDLVPRVPANVTPACALCARSSPDVSREPIKSCLKKPSAFNSPSASLSSSESAPKLLERVNREWNKAYDAPDADKVLHKISTDLDFLLNKSQDKGKRAFLDQIEEAPT